MSYITYQSPNGWTVLNSDRVFTHNVSLAAAKAAVVAAGFDDLSPFDNPVDLGVYKATLVSAQNSTIAFVEMKLESMEQSDQVDKLRALLTITADAASSLTAAIERENDLQAQAAEIARQQEQRRQTQLAEQERQRQAAAEAEQERLAAAQAAELKRLNRKATRNHDGTVDLTEAIPGQRGVRKVIARYPSVEAARAAGVQL